MSMGLRDILTRIRRRCGSERSVSDQELLDRYLSTNDQSAFELLVWRHGSMVLSACRRIVRCEHVAEDAFQATFWVLARQGRKIRHHAGMAAWLHRVATRVALQARVGKSAVSLTHDPVASDPSPTAAPEGFDEALAELPERFRRPLVLSYLEGKSNEEIAQELGVPVGTIFSRLARARERMRAGLLRRGIPVRASAGTLVVGVSLVAHVPASELIRRTVSEATAFAQGQIPFSPAIAVLAKGALNAMWMQRIRTWSMLTAACLVLSVAVGTVPGWSPQVVVEDEVPSQVAAPAPAPAPEPVQAVEAKPAPAPQRAPLSVVSARDAGAKVVGAKPLDAKALRDRDMKALRGLWLVHDMEMAGEAVPKEFAQQLKNEFTDAKFKWHGSLLKGGEAWTVRDGEHESEFVIDASKKPKQIDITLKSGNREKTILGIYELKDGELKLCISYVDQRPTEFSSKGQEGVFYYRLKRDKEENQPVPRKENLSCHDSTAIEWFLPGQFAEAVAKARKVERLLMVKGIAFGVDGVGAKCATHGNW